MKPKLFGRLAAAAVLLLSAATTTAHDFEINGIYYNYNDDGISVSVTCEGPYSSAYEDEYVGIITIPTEVSLSDKTFLVSSIGSGAFGECGKISSVILPNTIKSVCNFAFDGCCGITNIDIPNSVTSIGSYAFRDCSGLTSIGLSNTIESIGERAFMDCKSLSYFIIPNNIKVINVATFEGCCGLASVEIPESVTSIGEFAFLGCSSLSSLIMPNSVTDLGDNAFQDCNNLTNVNISSSLSKISVAAFANCSKLVSVVIPYSVTQIGGSAFNGCSDLRSITTLNPTPPTVESTTFYKVPSSCVLYVPAESVEAYRAAYGWSNFTNIEAIPEPEPDPNADTDLSRYENVMYVEGAKVNVGKQVKLSLKMNNVVEAVGFQCDFYVPEGCTVATDEFGDKLIELSTERTTPKRTNMFDFEEQPDGAIRIIAASLSNSPFSGNEGEVATIMLNVADDAEVGNKSIILRNIVLADADANPYKIEYVKTTLTIEDFELGDVNTDGKVNVADCTMMVGNILGREQENFHADYADINGDSEINVADVSGVVSVILNESSAQLMPHLCEAEVSECSIYGANTEVGDDGMAVVSVRMRNSMEVPSLQFDFVVPDGFQMATDEYGDYLIELSTERTTPKRTNVFDWNDRDDGSIRVVALSLNNATFSGNDGEVCRITLVKDGDIKPGDYVMTLRNAVISDLQGEAYYPEPTTLTVTVPTTTGSELVTANTDSSVEIYGVDGILRSKLQPGVNILRHSDGSTEKVLMK